MVLPGKVVGVQKDDTGYTRWNWDSAKARKAGVDVAALPHPTPRKPAHVRWLLHWFSIPGETVIDPFAGSGTVLAAGKEHGRNVIGIELEPRYCEVAVKRLRQEVLL